MAKREKQKPLFAEIDRIISVLRSGQRQDLVILIVPSHDKNQKQLNDQEMWAEAGMQLLGDVYGGATAFRTFKGVYRTESNVLLWDEPILLESYVKRDDLENEEKLKELLGFLKRMGATTNQAAVGLVINDVFHEITDYD
jgi:hypothetical protein